jgi:peptide deformylase
MIFTDLDQLRVNCEPVLLEEVNDIRNLLEKELALSAKKGFPGVGLACPQVGIYKKMAIVRIGDFKLDLVNANIAKQYYPFEFDGEGCLSFPGLFVKTQRYQEIVVENNLVYPNRFILTGFAAVVTAHELDHLQGILLPDIAIM